MDVTLPDTLEVAEALIAKLMPTALEMVASVIDEPGTSLESYGRLLAVAEQESPLLMLAMTRCAAGMATVADMASADVRSLIDIDLSVPEPIETGD